MNYKQICDFFFKLESQSNLRMLKMAHLQDIIA